MNRTTLSTLSLYFMAATLSASAVSCHCTTGSVGPSGPGSGRAIPRRIAARSANQTCPDPLPVDGGAWTVKPVFKAANGGELPAFLQGRCLYTWSGSGAPDPAGLPISQLTSVSDDPPVVIPLQAPTAADDVRVVNIRQRKETRRQSGWTEPVAGQAVFLGFPDTMPSNAPPGSALLPRGAVLHGFHMGWIARDLTCKEGGACLTVPLTEQGLDSGAVGSRAGFAGAIHTLVDRWIAAGGGTVVSTENPSPKRLVINVASGWEPMYDCQSSLPPPPRTGEPPVGKASGKSSQPEILGDDGQLRYPRAECGPREIVEASREVYVALLYATCSGALVIAAAGNNPGYRNLSGPMSPASWQRFPTPDRETCARLGLLREADDRASPLVYAVAGVDGNDWPIAVTRVGSRPPLVAPASMFVGYPDSLRDGYGAPMCTSSPCDPSFPVTGTSVAATVASSAAALVWAAHPGWSPSAVMQAVYDGGQELPMRAEVCLREGSCSQKVHRVALCGAAACAASGPSGCAAHPECVPRANPNGPPPSDIGSLLLPSNAVFSASAAGEEVGGQPVIPCPACLIALGSPAANVYPGSMTGTIDSQFFPTAHETNIHSPSLVLYTATRATMSVSNLAWNQTAWSTTSGLSVSATFNVTGLPASAWATWTGGSTHVYAQEVPIR